MKTLFSAIRFLSLGVLIYLITSPPSPATANVFEIFLQRQPSGSFRPFSEAEMAHLQRSLTPWFTKNSSLTVRDDCQPRPVPQRSIAHLTARTITASVCAITVPAYTAQGVLFVRPQGSTPARKPIYLQAPHQFFDQDTGQLGLQLFRESHAHALYLNTVSRKKYGSQPQDVVHIDNTLIEASSLSFAAENPDSLIVQLHGFAQSKRKSAKARQAHIILSNGTQVPPAILYNIKNCLVERVTPFTYLYPLEVSALGGTRNHVKKKLSEQLYNGFIHMELSYPIRQALIKEKELRSHLLSCLGT